MDIIDSSSSSIGITRRDIPQINGSSSGMILTLIRTLHMLANLFYFIAFIAVIVILVLIILASCTAVVYILRQDLADGDDSLTRSERGRYQGQRKYPRSPKNWFTGIFHNDNPRIKISKAQLDKPRNLSGRGWFRTGSGNDWEPASVVDDSPSQTPQRNTFSNMRMMDSDGSHVMPRFSDVGSYPHLPSSMSDAASSIRSEPHGVRGLSYTEQSAFSAQGMIPSLQSQFYSASPSPSPSLSPVMTPNESSPTALASRGLLHMEPSQSNISVTDVVGGGPFSESQPTFRRFEGGTKFIEGL